MCFNLNAGLQENNNCIKKYRYSYVLYVLRTHIVIHNVTFSPKYICFLKETMRIEIDPS